MKRVRNRKLHVAKPLYKTHANFDLSEDSEDEAQVVASKFSALQGGSPVAMFSNLLNKYKKPEEPIAKYLDDFCKYKLYLAYFAPDDTKEPLPLNDADDAALANDKKSIATAHVNYQEFKKRIAKHKEDVLKQLDQLPFATELKQCKELHVVKSKQKLVLGNGKQMTCASEEIMYLFLAVHIVLHFESYLAHLLEDVWNKKQDEIQGMTFCFIYEMFSPHLQPFRSAFQTLTPPPSSL